MTRSTTDKLKIGFVLDDGLDKPDGVQQYVLTLGEWFKSNGHEVRYLVGQSERKNIKELVELSKNIKVTFNGNKMSIPFWPKLRKIKSTLKREDFDVIHIQAPFSPVMGGRVLANLSENTAVVGTFHILPLTDSFFYRLGNKLAAISIRPGLKRIDKLFAVSKPAQKFAKKMYKIDSEVLGNPVKILPDSARKMKDFNDIDVIQIVFLGRLVYRKGCLTLLKAINSLNDDYKRKIQVKIGGTGNDSKVLEHYVKSHNLSGIVKFHGFIEESKKFKFLGSSDLAVFPSKGGESFGIVLIEAMASAGPVVLAGDNPGYKSVMQSNKDALFNPKSHNELAVKIAYFVDHKDAMNKMFSRQQKLVKNYDINKIGESLLVNFRSIVQNRNK